MARLDPKTLACSNIILDHLICKFKLLGKAHIYLFKFYPQHFFSSYYTKLWLEKMALDV